MMNTVKHFVSFFIFGIFEAFVRREGYCATCKKHTKPESRLTFKAAFYLA